MKKFLILNALFSFATCWDNIPKIPSNRRSQYYLREPDGAYEYGYDTGKGAAAVQKSTSENQVEGFYTFENADGRRGKIRYSAGVLGFKPIFQSDSSEILEQELSKLDQAHQQDSSTSNEEEDESTSNLDLNTEVPNVTEKIQDKISEESENVQREEFHDRDKGIPPPTIFSSNLQTQGNADSANQTGSLEESENTFHNPTWQSSDDGTQDVPNNLWETAVNSDDQESDFEADFPNDDSPRFPWEQFLTVEFPPRGVFNPEFIPPQFPHDHRRYSMEKSVHPTYTLITPAEDQVSFEYGPTNAIILTFLPPVHSEKYGYIYDTLN